MAKKSKKLSDLYDRSSTPADVTALLRNYFRSKQTALSNATELPAGDHPGMIGSHREALQRAILDSILPTRFSVGTGMVYGVHGRSKQADIVVWDSSNYPSLPVEGHNLFFSESVRLVIESKSSYSENNLTDMLEKCASVRDILSTHTPSLIDTIAMIQLDIHCIKSNQSHQGFIHVPHHIATAGFFVSGGNSICSKMLNQVNDLIDDCWPDTLLLLEPGILITKQYGLSDNTNTGVLQIWELKQDALLGYSASIIRLLSERSPAVVNSDFFDIHTAQILPENPKETIEFPLTRPRFNPEPIYD